MLDRLTIERMQGVAGEGAILVALSGGGDSSALLLLLAEHFGADRLSAGIVDHALRAGSAQDALRALEFAEARGVKSEILTLSWDGQTRSQQAAREKRHRALYDAARRCGARVIALGHTADDQAETVLMRAASGSAWRGLAGIAPLAPAPIWPEGRGLLLARPLLGARRAELRTLLAEQGARWIEDPGNENAAYERVRVRARLSALERAGFDAMRLVHLAWRMRMVAAGVDEAAAALIEQAVTIEDDALTVDRRAWDGGAVVRQRALSVLICAASGEARAPETAAVERLEARMRALAFRGATLGGAVLSVHGGCVKITRDAGALLGRADGGKALAALPAPPGEEVVWDGRLALTASAPGVMVYAAGAAPRIEAQGEARVATQWLLGARIAHMLRQNRKRD